MRYKQTSLPWKISEKITCMCIHAVYIQGRNNLSFKNKRFPRPYDYAAQNKVYAIRYK